MSKTFYVAAGGLLLLIGAVAGFVGIERVVRYPDRAFVIAAIFGGLGFLLLVMGLRSPFDPAHRRWVTRKLTPWNLVIGPGIAGVGVGVLYLFYNVLHVAPRIVLIGALLAVPVGLFVTASVFGDACARCDRLLESKTLRFAALAQLALERLRAGDVASALGMLGEPTADGAGRLEVGYCPLCKSVAVCRADGAPIVLRDASARLLIDRASRGP